MSTVTVRSGPRFHVAHAVFAAMESALLFAMGPLLVMQVISQLSATYQLPVVSGAAATAARASYLGIAIASVSFSATLLGNGRLAGLSLRAFGQALIAFYALYVVGRTYSFIVEGQISVSVSIFPIAFASACIALLKVLPPVFEHMEERAGTP